MPRTKNGHNPISPEEDNYIRTHHQTKTVIEIAAHLKRGGLTIYKYLDDNNLSVYKSRHGKVRKIHAKKDMFFEVDLINTEYTWII